MLATHSGTSPLFPQWNVGLRSPKLNFLSTAAVAAAVAKHPGHTSCVYLCSPSAWLLLLLPALSFYVEFSFDDSHQYESVSCHFMLHLIHIDF